LSRVTTRLFRLSIPLAVAALVAFVGATLGTARGQAPGASRKPNVIVITTDDQTVENLRVMKNVRNLLMRQGTTFDNSFVSFPLCCPSRATFLTGQYSHNHQAVGNSPAAGWDRFDHTNTLAVWLQRAGYATALVGKYLNGYWKRAPRYVPPGWSEWHAGLKLGYLGHTMNENGRVVAYRATNPRSYQTDVYTRKAVDVIRRRAPSPRPFFMWVSYWAPHHGTPRDLDDPSDVLSPSPAPRHRDRFALLRLPRWPSLNERDVSDKPAWVRRRPLLSVDRLAAMRERYQQRLESLLAVDEGVAAIVKELRKRGELSRTLLVFTSDNGFLEGQHRVPSGKTLLYEPSIRVPLIVRGPGVPRRLRLKQPVANVDLAPTIVDVANARARLVMDGRSLLPLFRDPRVEWGRDILIERGPGARLFGPRLFTAIRTPRYMFAEHSTGERELYDLALDPDQLDNVSGAAADPAFESELGRRLARLRDCTGVLCRRGPALSVSVSYQGACPNPLARARVAGGDQRLVRYADFTVAKRRTRDAAAPFEYAVSAATPSKLRVLAVLADGRRVTIDRTLGSSGC
jgi:N-acetylglucosamine-6-sulfatase